VNCLISVERRREGIHGIDGNAGEKTSLLLIPDDDP
jgi:hypothetical protein